MKAVVIESGKGYDRGLKGRIDAYLPLPTGVHAIFISDKGLIKSIPIGHLAEGQSLASM